MPLQSHNGRGASVIANATAHFGGPPSGPRTLPICDLLYSSWGGAPPMGAADMRSYERWRCRTLALRSLGSLSVSQGACQDGPTGSEEPEGEASTWEPADDKPDGIEEQEARRAEGFVLLRRCLPKGLPMDLIERTAWAECLSFFCRWRSSSCQPSSVEKASALQPVPLSSLVARLARRLWFLIPGGPHLLSVSSGGAGLLEMLPPWVSFFCEEIGAFFLFVLLHMAEIICGGNGVYVHLTDREWSARFQHLKWLLTFDSPPPPLPACSASIEEEATENAALHTAKDVTEKAFPVGGGRGQLDLPAIECIDISLSQHFPMNPQSAPHSFWLLFDRRSFAWVVCTESYALRSFPVLDHDGSASEGAPEGVRPEKALGMKQRRRPPPSLVDAAREDALRFLSLLGALPPSALSGNTAYLDSLQSEEIDTEASFPQEQQQQELEPADAAPEWTEESPMHSEAPPKCDISGFSLDGPQREDHKRRDSEGPAVAASCVIGEAGSMLQLQGLQPAQRAEETEEEPEGPVSWRTSPGVNEHQSGSNTHRESSAESDGSDPKVQICEGPLSSVEGDGGAQAPSVDGGSSVGASQKRKGKQQDGPQATHKRRKQQVQQHQKEQSQQQKTKKQQQHKDKQQPQQCKDKPQPQQHKDKQQPQQHKPQPQQHKDKQQPQQHKDKQQPQQHKDKQQQQYPGLQRVLDGLLQGGQKEFCGGRVLVGLRHKNALLDARLASFCRSHSNRNINGNVTGITEQECLASLQSYMQQHCERQKKTYLCDDKLRALTGRERLPYQREALAKALKAAGLIEHFMIDPRDLKEA